MSEPKELLNRAIMDELERQHINRHQLAHRLAGTIPKRTVYNLFDGKDVKISVLLAVLDQLNMRMVLRPPTKAAAGIFRKVPTLMATLGTEGKCIV
jgi:hypothetical protein